MNVLYAGSAGPLSVLPLRALCDAGYRPCAVAVDAGDSRLPQRRDLPVVTENQDSLESFPLLHDLPLIRLSRNAGDAAQQIRAYSPDIVFVSCFARKIPHEVLSVPAIGCFSICIRRRSRPIAVLTRYSGSSERA